jgi:hypothetical protein
LSVPDSLSIGESSLKQGFASVVEMVWVEFRCGGADGVYVISSDHNGYGSLGGGS